MMTVLLIVMALWSSFRIVRMVTTALEPAGSLDLHGIWYHTHFLRLGENPYQASLQRRELGADVPHFGPEAAVLSPQQQSGMVVYCSRYAPLLLAMFPLTFFSWPTTKLVWLAINLSVVALLPSLVVRLVHPDRRPSRRLRLLVQLATLCLLATSVNVGNGQTTAVTLVLSLAALLIVERYPLTAGVAAGIALSQPAVGAPFFLTLLARHRLRAAVTAVAVQVVGLGIIAAWTTTSPVALVRDYWRLVVLHADKAGVHFTGSLPHYPVLAIAMTILSTLVAAFAAWTCLRRRFARLAPPRRRLLEVHLLALCCLWYLVVLYHREYDAMLFIVFFAVVVIGLEQDWWGLSGRGRLAVSLALAALTALMSRPGESLASVSPNWARPAAALLSSNAAASAALFAALVMCAVLLSVLCRSDTGPVAVPPRVPDGAAGPTC
jgi:hypothetical protein